MGKENIKVKSGISTKYMTLTALMTAVICIMGPFSIPLPFSPVPISFTNFAIYLALYVVGMKRGTLSYVLYAIIGIAGVPVFSGFSSGIAKFVGPTGGYLIGFIFLALIAGFFIEKFPQKKLMGVAGMIIGLCLAYIFGTTWLALQNKISFFQALIIGVVPYLVGDAIKIAVAAIIGPKLRNAAQQIM